MAIPTDLPPTSESSYQNIQNNQPIKLTLCERVSQLFSRLYEKISNLFSRKPNQIKKLEGIESIYDVPQNNQPVKKPTFCERISNLFSIGPNPVELLEKKVNGENAYLHLLIARVQQDFQQLKDYIHIYVQVIRHLETRICALEDAVVAKETENNLLKETISSLKHKPNPHLPISRSDSGFSEPPTIEKKQSSFSKAGQCLKTKIGLGNH